MNRFAVITATLMCTLLLLSYACGDDNRFRRVSSTDISTQPARTMVFQRGEGGLGESPSSIEIQQNGELDLTVTAVYIEGFEDCDRTKFGLGPREDLPNGLEEECEFIIASGARLDDGSPQFVSPQNPLVLNTGASRTFDLVYQELNPDVPASATLVIQSNASSGEVRIELSVEAAKAQIVVNPTTIGFPGGASGSSLLNLVNRGSGPLVVSDVQVRRLNPPPVDPATMMPLIEFTLDDNEVPSLPWELEPGQSQLVRVLYEPQDAGNDNAELVFISNDAARPELAIFMTSAELTSSLQVQPNPIIFPPQRNSEPSSARVTFVNNGLDTLFVNEISIEQPNSDYTTGNEQTSFQLIGGQSREVSITYRASTPEGSSAVLVVRTDADNISGGQLTIPLEPSAEGVTAIGISPLGLDFSSVELGGEATQDIELSNPGGTPLTVNNIRLSTEDDGLPTDPQFTIAAGGGQVNLAPGATHTVSVRFTRAADDQNRRVGQLVVESDAQTSPDVVNFFSNPPRQPQQP